MYLKFIAVEKFQQKTQPAFPVYAKLRSVLSRDAYVFFKECEAHLQRCHAISPDRSGGLISKPHSAQPRIGRNKRHCRALIGWEGVCMFARPPDYNEKATIFCTTLSVYVSMYFCSLK